MPTDNRVVIVTGAARGIGYATALNFAHKGARLVLFDVDEETGKRALDGILAAGAEAVLCVGDVSERLDVHNMVARALEAYGRVDVLVNNAGVNLRKDFFDVTEEDFDKVMAVHVKGGFLATQAVARQMIKQMEEESDIEPSPYAIVNVSSIAAVVAMPMQVPYGIAKGAVSQLTKVSAVSLAPHGIRVNAVGPGSINTELLANVITDEETRQVLLDRTPVGRVGEPSEIANAIYFLASPEASYITGQVLYVDGGRLALNYSEA